LKEYKVTPSDEVSLHASASRPIDRTFYKIEADSTSAPRLDSTDPAPLSDRPAFQFIQAFRFLPRIQRALRSRLDYALRNQGIHPRSLLLCSSIPSDQRGYKPYEYNIGATVKKEKQ
jgi:hypothetical protein